MMHCLLLTAAVGLSSGSAAPGLHDCPTTNISRGRSACPADATCCTHVYFGAEGCMYGCCFRCPATYSVPTDYILFRHLVPQIMRNSSSTFMRITGSMHIRWLHAAVRARVCISLSLSLPLSLPLSPLPHLPLPLIHTRIAILRNFISRCSRHTIHDTATPY